MELIIYDPSVQDNILPGLRKDLVEFKYCNKEIKLHQISSAVASIVWDSAPKLCDFLCNTTIFPNGLIGKNIIELGSGTGIVSIVAALLGATVVATDLSNHLDILSKNISENISDNKVTIMALEWGKAEDISKIKNLGITWDYILCSDLVYLPELYKPLYDTLLEISSINTIILLAQRRRYEREEMFFNKVKLSFSIIKMFQHDSITIYEIKKLFTYFHLNNLHIYKNIQKYIYSIHCTLQSIDYLINVLILLFFCCANALGKLFK